MFIFLSCETPDRPQAEDSRIFENKRRKNLCKGAGTEKLLTGVVSEFVISFELLTDVHEVDGSRRQLLRDGGSVLCGRSLLRVLGALSVGFQ